MNRNRRFGKAWSLRWTLGSLAVAMGLCSAATAGASLVSVDLTANSSAVYSGSATTAGGLVPLPGQTGDWNELNLGAQFAAVNTTVSVADLISGTGDPTPIDFFLNTGTTNWPAPRPLTAFNAAGTDPLGNDIAFITDNSEVGWRFEGLVPNRAYQLRFFGQVDSVVPAANFATFYAPGGVSASTTALQNYVDLETWSNSAGVIVGYFQRVEVGGNVASSISGVQLLAIPEPASMTTLSLALIGWLTRRRS